MQGNNPAKTPDYFEGDIYIQHNTAIADGLSGLGAALAAMAEQNIQMIYTTVHQVLAQGNFVGRMAKLPSIGMLWKQSLKNPPGRTRTVSFSDRDKSDRYSRRRLLILCLSDGKGKGPRQIGAYEGCQKEEIA